MSHLIRNATADDLRGLLALYSHLSPEDPILTEEDAEPRLAALLASDMAKVLVAEAEGQLVATCLLLIVPNLTRGGRAFAIVENVVTHEGHRRKGLGTALMQEVLTRSWAANCYKVMIATGRTEAHVLRFYEQAGFTRGGKTFFQARRDT